LAQPAYKIEPALPDAEMEPTGPHSELEDCCADELSHAVAHQWLELETLLPWTDTLPADERRAYPVTRSYRWADLEGGDMVCEVTVHELPDRSGHVVRRSCVIQRG